MPEEQGKSSIAPTFSKPGYNYDIIRKCHFGFWINFNFMKFDLNEYIGTKLQNLLITFQIPFALIRVPISFFNYNLSVYTFNICRHTGMYVMDFDIY